LNDIDLAIVAAGYLPPENMELDPALVRKSMMVNSVGVVTVLSALANRMHIQNRGHILHISTVAVIRPRLRNFNYGASKSSADFFAMGLSSKYRTTGLKVSVLRPGYVHTKMTNNFSPAPFATNTKLVARNAIQGVIKDRIVIYAPGFLRIFFLFLKILPNFIFKVIDQKS
jgi:decaprenylphospho-beta-D-erythro-pentofuranosid-2-ulose 2-reductase